MLVIVKNSITSRPSASRHTWRGKPSTTSLRVGAAGYVLKDASRREVVDAVRQVLNGESPLDPKLSAQLIRRLASRTRESSAAHGDDLTHREMEVLRLVAEGKTNAEIAQNLFISVGTVKVHVERIIDKLGHGPFVFNLGHGVVPQTPPEHVAQLVEIVRNWKPSTT